MREPVIAAFPTAPGLPEDTEAWLSSVDELYRSDAWHSLSIEGYRVTLELIERVRSGDWDPDHRDSDRRSRDALAARGYWQAFRLVRETVRAVIAGDNPAVLVRAVHQDWYRELFQPSVAAGLVPASELAGYRNGPVFLRGSRHVPPRREAVRDAMPTFFDLLEGGDRAFGEGGPRALAVRLYPPLRGWQRPHGALRHECAARIGRLSVDRDPRRRSRDLPRLVWRAQASIRT